MNLPLFSKKDRYILILIRPDWVIFSRSSLVFQHLHPVTVKTASWHRPLDVLIPIHPSDTWIVANTATANPFPIVDAVP